MTIYSGNFADQPPGSLAPPSLAPLPEPVLAQVKQQTSQALKEAGLAADRAGAAAEGLTLHEYIVAHPHYRAYISE